MDQIVLFFYSFLEDFFEMKSPNEKVSKRIKRGITGTLIFILCMFILISYIVLSEMFF